MARTYNLIERLKNRNARPMVILDEDHQFAIDTSKTNVLCIMAYVKQQEKKKKANKENDDNDPERDVKLTDKIIEMALGKKASDYIQSQDYTFAVIQDIIDVIMAAIADEKASFEKDAEEANASEKK